MLRSIGIGRQSRTAEESGGNTVSRIELPLIGARTSLADLLQLLGSPAVARLPDPQPTFTNRRVHRGQSLLLSGQPFEHLYAVLSGSFKSTLHEADGSQQIVAFPMRGDLIGLDARQSGRHPVTVAALEESNVAMISQRELVELVRTCPVFEEAFMKAVSIELLRNYQAMRAMGALGAEARLARFLNRLGERMARFGFSPRAFRLTMTRSDIASYLGLSIETVSRAFTSLARRSLIEVSRRSVRIADAARLTQAEEYEPHSLQLAAHERTQGAKSARRADPPAPKLELVN